MPEETLLTTSSCVMMGNWHVNKDARNPVRTIAWNLVGEKKNPTFSDGF